jgi:hypothetical protein
MKKKIVQITKRMIISSDTTDDFQKSVWETAFTAVDFVMRGSYIPEYAYERQTLPQQVADTIEESILEGIMKDLYPLQGRIPAFFDDAGRIAMMMNKQGAKYPDITLLKYTKDARESFRIALSFETGILLLLDVVGTKLLFSPYDEGEEGMDTQSFYRDTFFITLTDDLYFSRYEEV